MKTSQYHSCFFVIVLVLLIVSLVVNLYQDGDMITREKAKNALLIAVDNELEHRLSHSEIPFFTSSKGRAVGRKIWVKDCEGLQEMHCDSLDFSTESMIKQTILKDRCPLNADSLDIYWRNVLNLIGVKGKTALQVMTYGKNRTDSSSCSTLSTFADTLMCLHVGVKKEVRINAFFTSTISDAFGGANWNHKVIIIHLSLIVLLLYGCVYQKVNCKLQNLYLCFFIRKKIPFIQNLEEGVWLLGDVGFCYSSQSLSKAETVYKLRSQLSDLLKLFLESPDYELTNEQIKKVLWIALGDIPTSDKKNRIISDLRKELETFHVPVLIETKGKMGYRLVPKAT